MADAVATAKRDTTTADDTLKQKSRDPNVVSGGHLVAKALKNEGVDTIFTLCGGHIIDIYDGCVDEGIRIIDVRHEQVAAHAADGYARQTGKLGCVVTTAGPGCMQRDDRHRHRVPLGEPGPPYRRPGRADPAHDGLAPGPAACRHHAAHHQVLGRRALDRAHRRHDRDGGARMLRRRARPRLSRNSARHPRPRDRHRQGGHPASPAITAPRPSRWAIPPTSRRSPTSWSRSERPASCSAARCGPRAATRRRSNWCARSTSPPISTAPGAASCRRATRIISTARAPMASTRPM